MGRSLSGSFGFRLRTTRELDDSGRGFDYYRADPNLRFVLEGVLDADTLAW